MEHKILKMEIKDLDEASGEFTGYAMVFGVIDSYNDITHQGAFKRTLKASKGQVAIFKMHQPTLMIGMGDTAKEDDKGLLVNGTLDVNVNQTAREEFSLMNMAAKRKVSFGLSIGYNAIRFDYDEIKNVRIRNLREIALYEYSTTPPNFQAVPGAVVADLKSVIGNDFDPDWGKKWLTENSEILNYLMSNKNMILNDEDNDSSDALLRDGTTDGLATTSIDPDDLHSIGKAIENLKSLLGGKAH